MVRDDVAVGAYDDAGAERLLSKLALRLLLRLRRAPPEEVVEERVVEERVLLRRAHAALRAYCDDGGRDLRHDVRVRVVLDVDGSTVARRGLRQRERPSLPSATRHETCEREQD